MSKLNTQGSLCEVKAAAELFLYEFQVHQNGCLIATFGQALLGVKILRFTGNFNSGHYDVSVPMIESINNDVIQSNSLNNSTELFPVNEQTESVHMSICDPEMQLLPKGAKKRRKRFSGAIRAQQLREAASKYVKNHKEVHIEAVKKSKKKSS